MRHRILGSLLTALLFLAMLCFAVSAGYLFQHLGLISVVFLISFPVMTVVAYVRV
jgi:hypothetical protein